MRILSLFLLAIGSSAWAAPQFCNHPDGKAEQLICSDSDLQARDKSLNAIYAVAKQKAKPAQQKLLAAEQKGWWRGIRDCWKVDDLQACVASGYELRTVELQTTWRLVPAHGPLHFRCADGADIDVTYFETQPPSLIATRKGEQSLMRSAPAASGARYVGRNESFWEHQGEVRITWGYQAPETTCVKQ